TAAISSSATVCTSPQIESAILIRSTPRLHCLRVSRMNSSRVLHKTPAVSAGLPFKGRVRIGIENAAVVAEGPARDNHARALEQPAPDRLAHCHNGKPFTTRHDAAGHHRAQDTPDRIRRP